jgi:hypothetical protein
MGKFLEKLMGAPEVKPLLSDEHFSVDGTLLQPSWALPQGDLCRSDLSNSRQSGLLPAPWHSLEWSKARSAQE